MARRITAVTETKDTFSHDKVLYTQRIDKFIELDKPLDRETFLSYSPFPWSVDIQPTAICNQRCVFCSHVNRNKALESNSFNIMSKLHKDLVEMGTRGIIYTGGGDPLSWRDSGVTLPNWIKNYNYQQAKPSVVTNGVMCNKLLDIDVLKKLHFVSISVYAHNAQLYKNVVGVDSFSVHVKNIRNLIKMKKENNLRYPEISLKLLINKENYKYVSEIYSFLKELEADHIMMRCVSNLEEGANVALSYNELQEVKEQVFNKMDIADHYVKDFADSLLPLTREEPASNCWTILLGHNALISTTGEVYIEIPYQSREQYCIGNLNNNSFKEIWGSRKHIEVINLLNQKMKCNKCDLDMCRHHTYNLIIDSYLNNKIKVPNFQKFDEKHGYYL